MRKSVAEFARISIEGPQDLTARKINLIFKATLRLFQYCIPLSFRTHVTLQSEKIASTKQEERNKASVRRMWKP